MYILGVHNYGGVYSQGVFAGVYSLRCIFAELCICGGYIQGAYNRFAGLRDSLIFGCGIRDLCK